MPIWLSPTVLRYIGIAALVVGVFGFGYYKGYENCNEKFTTFKAEVAAKAAEQEAKVQLITKAQDSITKESSNVFKANRLAVRTYYSGLQHSADFSKVSILPNAAPGVNGYPAYAILAGQCGDTEEIFEKYLDDPQYHWSSYLSK